MERFIPDETFEMTPEGQEAGILSLKEQAKSAPELKFVPKLLEEFPDARVALVGGIVRDSIIGLSSKDYDLVVENLTQEKLEEALQEHGNINHIEGRAYGVTKLTPKGTREIVDIALPRSEVYEQGKRAGDAEVETEGVTIEDDFSRRDFTINALGLDLKNGTIIDPFNGLSDIKNRQIKAVGDPKQRFLEDPARILRGARFAARFDFDIEEKTHLAMQNLKDEIFKTFKNKKGQEVTRVSSEKIGEEITKIINCDPQKLFEIYEKTGLMDLLFPEVSALQGVPQPKEFHSEGDAYIHTQLAIDNIPNDAPLEVKLATLFHDVGKKDTFKSADETGDRIRFNGHDDKSAEIARKILNRFKIPNDQINAVAWLIENHMKILVSFRDMKLSKQKQMASHPQFLNLLTLAEADAKASLKPDGSVDLSFLPIAQEIYQKIQAELKKGIPQEMINGDEIIQIMKRLQPDFDLKKDGPTIGKIKRTVNESYQDKDIKTKEEAFQQVQKMLKNLK